MDTRQMIEALERPFEQTKVRMASDGTRLEYVSANDVIRRVREVEPAYDWRLGPIATVTVPDSVDRYTGELRPGYTVLTVTGSLHIPGLGAKDGIGTMRVDGGVSDEMLRGVATIAFASAAKMHGVALYLYRNGDEDTAPTPTPAQDQQRPQVQETPTPPPAPTRPDVQGRPQVQGRPVSGYPASPAQVKYVDDLMHRLEMDHDDLYRRFGPDGDIRNDRGEPIMPGPVAGTEHLKSWQAKAIITDLKEKEDSGGQTKTMRGPVDDYDEQYL